MQLGCHLSRTVQEHGLAGFTERTNAVVLDAHNQQLLTDLNTYLRKLIDQKWQQRLDYGERAEPNCLDLDFGLAGLIDSN